MLNDRPLKILVVGCGSIGRRHIRLLKEMGVEAHGLEATSEQAAEAHAATEIPIYVLDDPNWLHTPFFQEYDGAIIATPNHLHARPAQAVVACGRTVLIEKPITVSVHDAEVLVSESAPDQILVGYCLRFHPGLRRLKELIDSGAIGKVRHASIHFGSYLPDWRPGFDYRQGYAASKEQGGGILLDASHELDYASWLFGEPASVMAQVQNTGALEIETEDVADLLVRFQNGVQANIHLDYLNRSYSRGCTIIGDKGTVTWTWTTNVVHWTCDGQQFCERPGISDWIPDEGPWPPFDVDDMYRAELRHFLACIRGEETPHVTGEDGIQVLRLVEAAKRSSVEGRVVTL